MVRKFVLLCRTFYVQLLILMFFHIEIWRRPQISAWFWLFLQEMRMSPLMSPHQSCSLDTTWWVLFHVSDVHEASMLETEALCTSFGSSLTEEDASSFDKNMEKDTRQQAKTHTRGHHTGSLPRSEFCKISTWVSVREILISPHFLPSVPCAVEHWAASGCRTSTRWQELSTWVLQKKIKENEKLWRTESGCHLGPLSCLVTRVFILNSCVCVHPLRQKRWVVVLSHNTLMLLHRPLTIAVVRSVPMATRHNRPFYMVGVWSTAVLNVTSCLSPGEVRELSF